MGLIRYFQDGTSLRGPFSVLSCQRTVIAFPDVNGYQEWNKKASELTGLRITVSDYLETTATPEEREAHIDIADRLIAQLRDGTLVPPEDCPTEAQPLSPLGTRETGTIINPQTDISQ